MQRANIGRLLRNPIPADRREFQGDNNMKAFSRFLRAAMLPVFAACGAEVDSSGTAIAIHQPQGNPIVGGEVAPEIAWPWAVALGWSGGTVASSFFCGGSLVSSQYVLTAAHCVDDKSADDISVTVGRHRLSSTHTGVRSKVTDIYIHPRYSPWSLDYDIAILRTLKSMPYQAIPIAGTDVLWPYEQLTTIGWGRTSRGGEVSDDLLQLDVNAIPQSVCSQTTTDDGSVTYVGSITARMLCAGLMEGSRGVCHGDSGGPLMVRTPGGWLQVGITSFVASFDEPCAHEGFPDVYSNVSALKNFVGGFVGVAPPTPSHYSVPLIEAIL
jgi:secreted trypsin-like serine protease